MSRIVYEATDVEPSIRLSGQAAVILKTIRDHGPLNKTDLLAILEQLAATGKMKLRQPVKAAFMFHERSLIDLGLVKKSHE